MASSSTSSAKLEFTSFHSAVDDGKFAVTVGFSRDPADEQSLDGLILQRGKDPRDDISGVAGVNVEIPIQRHAIYGGIRLACLRREIFTVSFDDAVVPMVGGLHEILVHFRVGDEQFRETRDGLRFVFTGCSCYHEDDETVAQL